VEMQGREMELRAAIQSATEDAAAFQEALQKREAELQGSMRSARETAAALQEELRRREDRCLALTDEIDRMSNSRSWRSTAPLRTLMRLARREQQ